MAFDKLRSLRCFPEVDKKIRAGVPCENIAEWVQEDKGEYTDVKTESVVRQLYRYKESIPTTDLEDAEPLYLRKKIEMLKRGVNEATELEKLYLLQLSRISLLVQQEDKIRFTQTQTRKEIELAKGLLLDLAGLKMDLGVYSRTPGELTVNHKETGALAQVDPERRKAIGEVAQKLLKALQEQTGEQTLPILPSQGQSEEEVQDADYEIVGGTEIVPTGAAD